MPNPFRGLQLTDWTDAGEERKNKRRSVGEPNTTPDLGTADVREGIVLVAIVDLVCLSPYWGKGFDANWSIIERHVDSICNQLSVTDRRYDSNHRCQANAPEELLNTILASFSPEDLARSRYMSACDPEGLAVVNLKNLFKDRNDFLTFTLEAGQHRRAAVLKMAHLPITSTAGVFKKDDLHLNNQTTMWPVEFWSTEYLRLRPRNFVNAFCDRTLFLCSSLKLSQTL